MGKPALMLVRGCTVLWVLAVLMCGACCVDVASGTRRWTVVSLQCAADCNVALTGKEVLQQRKQHHKCQAMETSPTHHVI